jgi:hypothetical protein
MGGLSMRDQVADARFFSRPPALALALCCSGLSERPKDIQQGQNYRPLPPDSIQTQLSPSLQKISGRLSRNRSISPGVFFASLRHTFALKGTVAA